jgi:BirA family biotin operon repressor/biotin-[acetyl-CoA-carboxylase] ligase
VLGSTNDEAMARARSGDPGQLWITAQEQTSGKGRLGRQWVSAPGNLYASLLLIDPVPPVFAPRLGFVAGLALARTLAPLLGDAVRLKWPNDAVVEGAKIAGILLEATQTSDGCLACVIGIGINCAHHPQDLPYAATDLASLGISTCAEDVFATLAHELALVLEIFDEGRGFAAIRSAWLGHAAGLGESIRVLRAGQSLEGLFNGLDVNGRLLLQTQEGLQTIDAGDVFLGPSARNPQDQ